MQIQKVLACLMSLTKDEHQHILWHIYDNYRDEMFYMAISVIRNFHFAEDVLQVSFERIINKMHLLEKVSRNDMSIILY